MRGKKELLAQVSAVTGATRVLESLPGRAGLLILNYHRVGDFRQTPYDSGTFSCTTGEFDWQVGWLKRHFALLTLEAAVAMIRKEWRPRQTAVLLTFDDGYRDNYDEAFPVLERHGVPAAFFVPTAFAGTGKLPWWDVIAYVVKRSARERLELRYPATATFELSGEEAGPAGPRRLAAIRDILKMFKAPAMTDAPRFLRELEEACGTAAPGDESERCFLSWDEARTMQRGGMSFGSHTHTHPILSKLSREQQVIELETSRAILERELRQPVDTLAYPVGQRDSFSAVTIEALERTGYRTAFSFYSGVNQPGQVEPFDVRRTGVDGESRAIFRLRTASMAVAGRGLV